MSAYTRFLTQHHFWAWFVTMNPWDWQHSHWSLQQKFSSSNFMLKCRKDISKKKVLLYHGFQLWNCSCQFCYRKRKVGTFCLLITAELFVHFFICWLYKKTENESTVYNASDVDLLLSCHILKWFWTSSSFRCRSEVHASRWLRGKKNKVRLPFKIVIFVSG